MVDFPLETEMEKLNPPLTACERRFAVIPSLILPLLITQITVQTTRNISLNLVPSQVV